MRLISQPALEAGGVSMLIGAISGTGRPCEASCDSRSCKKEKNITNIDNFRRMPTVYSLQYNICKYHLAFKFKQFEVIKLYLEGNTIEHI